MLATRSCPYCGTKGSLKTQIQRKTATIETAFGSIEADVSYPQIGCTQCGEAFTNAEGAAAYDAAIAEKRKTFAAGRHNRTFAPGRAAHEE
jgi:hypothetical protein